MHCVAASFELESRWAVLAFGDMLLNRVEQTDDLVGVLGHLDRDAKALTLPAT
jgi:hypothetical protein